MKEEKGGGVKDQLGKGIGALKNGRLGMKCEGAEGKMAQL